MPTPTSHEWELLELGIWVCPWCGGFIASDSKPHEEAIATGELSTAKLQRDAAKSPQSEEKP